MLEATGTYRGVYHVLMGRLAPLEGIGPGELTIEPLLARLRREGVREVIIGTNPTFDGDGTALYLARRLAGSGVKVSRLARGLASGSSLETSSKAALAEALEGRRPLEG
jgi:recombination protein RecR